MADDNAIVMVEPVELLATRRPKRATAGNRMAEALAEMALDEFNKDLDDDNDFVNDKDEEDVFESDFASTDEEVQQEAIDGGEKEVHDEEKQARKAARSRLERATAAAHAKNKATFNPNTTTSASISKPKPPKKSRRRLTLDTDSDDGGDGRKGTKRKSKRVHTVQNTLVTTTRIKESEKKKASAPRKAKPAPTLAPTQAELIMAALENEEGNIVEHRDYLKIEEEKRLRATRVTRQVVQGPLVRWISRAEDVKVVVEVAPPEKVKSVRTSYYATATKQASFMYPQTPLTYAGFRPGASSSAQAGLSMSSSSSTTMLKPIPVTTTLQSQSISQTPHLAQTSNPAPPQPSSLSQSTAQSQSAPQPQQPPQSQPQILPQPEPTPFAVWPPAPAPVVTPAPPAPIPPSPILDPNIDPQLQIRMYTPPTPAPPAVTAVLPPVQSPVPPAPTLPLPPTTPATLATPVPVTTSTPTTPATASYQPYTSPYTYTSGKYPTLPPPAPQYAIPQPTVPPPPPPEPERTEKQGKNYIIHELAQSDDAPRKPAWKDTMTALFGDHVKWDEVKVHSGKGRPMSRPVQICAITGLPARYLDRRSGVPFADARAYRVLTGLLQHEYIWNQQLGCYIGREEVREQQEIPNEMDVDED